MNKQKIINKSRSYAANLAAGEVSSLRIKEDEKTVIRVYDGGKIGVAGRIGEGDDSVLEVQAREALSQNISYPDAMGGGERREVNLIKEIIPESGFLNAAKELAARLKERFPDFIFSDKFILEEQSSEYCDSNGTELSFSVNAVQITFMIKSTRSANILDLEYCSYKDFYDEEAVVEDIAKLLDVYSNKLPMPEENLPVIISTGVIQYILSHMTAKRYSSGAGLLSGKLGQKLFDEKIDILTDRTPGKSEGVPFFDDEGVTISDDKFYFVKDGVFCGLSACRRSAAALGLPLSGGGYAEFDGIPQSGNFRGIEVDAHGKKLSEVFKGKGIYIRNFRRGYDARRQCGDARNARLYVR